MNSLIAGPLLSFSSVLTRVYTSFRLVSARAQFRVLVSDTSLADRRIITLEDASYVFESVVPLKVQELTAMLAQSPGAEPE